MKNSITVRANKKKRRGSTSTLCSFSVLTVKQSFPARERRKAAEQDLDRCYLLLRKVSATEFMQ